MSRVENSGLSVVWGELSSRERDALVAERVMGWTDVRMGTTGLAGGVDPGSNYRGHVPVPSFTTDIAAAWSVVENLASRGIFLEVKPGIGFVLVESDLNPDDGEWLDGPEAFAPTAPEAISIVALEAVGTEVRND